MARYDLSLWYNFEMWFDIDNITIVMKSLLESETFKRNCVTKENQCKKIIIISNYTIDELINIIAELRVLHKLCGRQMKPKCNTKKTLDKYWFLYEMRKKMIDRLMSQRGAPNQLNVTRNVYEIEWVYESWSNA